MFQGLSIINNSTKGLGFLKELVLNGSFEWKVEMPEVDFSSYLKSLPEEYAEKEKEKGSVILVSRLYLDADLVTEMTQNKFSKELFVKRYPEKIEAHWLKINTDIQSLNKFFLLVKVFLLALTSGVYLTGIGGINFAISLLVANVVSFIWPKLFAKSIVFVMKRFI